MKSTLKSALLMAALCLVTRPLVAADGILIVEKTTKGGTTRTNQSQIEKTRVRAESAGPTGGQQVFVFDGPAQVMRIIDYDKKTHTEMTKADMDRLGGQMAGAMAKMQEQMKNLTPAQRAQMEAIMPGREMAGAAAPAKTEYRKAGTSKVGKWTCDRYDGYQNNQKTSEVCTVDPKTLGFAVADFEVTRQLGDFVRQLMPQNADQMFSIGVNDPQGFSGLPVRRAYSIGQRQWVSELTEVTRQTFADSIFGVPAGFQKQALGMPGR